MPSNTVGRVLRSLACLGIAGVFAADSSCGAQTPQSPARLTARPHEMATGTRTERAGVQTLDSIPDYLVYICTKCVGTKRVPLVVILHGGGGDSQEQMDWMREFAEKYDMIMLVPTAIIPGRWDAVANMAGMGDGSYPDLKNIDAAMKQVLRKYAIDPDRIGLGGMSDGGSYSLFLGRANLDIFSRIAPLSPGIYYNEPGPANSKTQFFLAAGVLEDGGFYTNPLQVADELRETGNPAKQVLMLRPHQQRSEDYAYMWQWFHDSWAEPNPAARPAPRVTADLTTELTPDAVKKMAAFWTSLTQEPDSILTTGRLANLREYAVHAGEHELSVRMMDMAAMAAKYPAVAADLKQAGLTAAEEEAYRAALISAKATANASDFAGNVAPGSVLGKNVEFLNAQAAALDALDQTGM
jgi:predicted esterase